MYPECLLGTTIACWFTRSCSELLAHVTKLFRTTLWSAWLLKPQIGLANHITAPEPFLASIERTVEDATVVEMYTERLVCECRPEYETSSRCFCVCRFQFFQCRSTMRGCVCMFIQVGSNETIHWNSSWSVQFKFRTFNYIYGGWSYWFQVLWTSASSTELTSLELLLKAWLLYCFLLLWSYRPVEMPGGQAWRDEATIWYSKVAHSTIGAVSVCSKSSCQVGGH